MDLHEIRVSLYRRRQALGLSQAEVARRMGMTQSTVSDLESGVCKNPTIGTVKSWAEALDLRFRIVLDLPFMAEEGAA